MPRSACRISASRGRSCHPRGSDDAVGEMSEAAEDRVSSQNIPWMAFVKRIRPANMMPTKRLLFDIDESASIAEGRQRALRTKKP